MTGFGSSQGENDSHQISVEIKTLNSKFLDATIRLPRMFTHRELDIRNLVAKSLERGKVSVTIEYEKRGETAAIFNRDRFKTYYKELEALRELVGASSDDLFKLAIQQPDVGNQDANAADDEDWKVLVQHLGIALEACNEFRNKEGQNLESVLMESSKRIRELKDEVAKLDVPRTEQIKSRIRQNLDENVSEGVDENRFEQELIYYIEKFDISEELARLKSHLDYFEEVLGDPDSQGKKLGFISQEMGREINTIGSKSNDAGMQRCVVQMKDALEQIKEQVLNVL